MSTTEESAAEAATEPAGSWITRERYIGLPPVNSWEDARALIEGLVAQIRPWPEQVTVVSISDIAGRLVSAQAEDELKARIAGYPGQFTLPREAMVKARAIWDEVVACLKVLNGWPRIPVEMALVIGDGVVAPLWGETILQLLDEAPEGAPSGLEPALGIIRDAGEDGISVRDLYARLTEGADVSAPGQVTFTALCLHLSALAGQGAAGQDLLGIWHVAPESEPSS